MRTNIYGKREQTEHTYKWATLQLQGVFVMRTRHVGIARVIFIVNIITWGYIYK